MLGKGGGYLIPSVSVKTYAIEVKFQGTQRGRFLKSKDIICIQVIKKAYMQFPRNGQGF